jgi:hypothetical protein
MKVKSLTLGIVTAGVVCACLAQEVSSGSLKLSPAQIQKAIAAGKQYKTRDQFLNAGMKQQKIQISSAFAMDGISKYLVVFTDYDVVAAESAAANQQMREFSEADAQKLPLAGLMYVDVQLHGRGDLPVMRLQNNFGGTGPHLVFQMGDKIIQPLAKKGEDSGTVPANGPSLISVWRSGNMSTVTAQPLGFSQERIDLEFAFDIPQDDLGKNAKAILIDNKGKRYSVDVKLAALAHSSN